MIQVDKKFELSPSRLEDLISRSTRLREVSIMDVYYDNPQYSLTLNDQWLRERDSRFQLKIPTKFNNGTEGFVNSYIRLGEDEIKQRFGLRDESMIKNFLTKNGYAPFCVCRTSRRTYVKNGFTIGIDLAVFEESFRYSVCEIELVVNSIDLVPQAEEKIIQFANSHELELKEVRSKVVEYLKHKRPPHFKTLLEAGVVT